MSNNSPVNDNNPVGNSNPASDAASTLPEVPIRVLLAKLGLDGHDRGIKVVARMLRDAGCEVIYLGLRQTPESIISAAEQEDADVIGLSMHNGGHLALAQRMMTALRAVDNDTPLVLGGIVPEVDMAPLFELGVAAVLGPGSSADDVVATVRRVCAVHP